MAAQTGGRLQSTSVGLLYQAEGGKVIESCDECGTELVDANAPIPLRVMVCPKCDEDGPSQRQIEAMMDAPSAAETLELEARERP